MKLGRLVIFFGLVSIAVVACSAEPPAADGQPGADAESAEVDDDREFAPEFTLQDLDGNTVELAALRGKTVVLDFWATWCPPCEFQVPELNAFYQAHQGDSSVEVIGISVDTDGPEVVSAWVAEKQVQYRIVIGDEDLARRYGAMGFPTLIVVAPDGTVDSRHVGLIETADLEEALARQGEV